MYKFIISFLAFLVAPLACFCEHHHHEHRYEAECYPYVVYVAGDEVLLSNGYSWRRDHEHYDCHREEESTHRLWKEGDHVYFTISGRSSKGHPKGTLYNYDLEKMMSEAKPGKYSLVGTVHWEEVSHERQRISYIDSHGHNIVLSGGSRWNVGFWSGMTSKHWKEGELIQMSPQYHNHLGDATHTLTNISHGLETVNATLLKD